MYYKINDVEIRGICKDRLESLEYWLRRIIDETLSKKFGDYINYSDEYGNKLIKSEFAKSLLARKTNEPERYPRLVDAILLNDAIKIICNPNVYKNHFAEFLNIAFPDGQTEARTFMMRLIPARNALVILYASSIKLEASADNLRSCFCMSETILCNRCLIMLKV